MIENWIDLLTPLEKGYMLGYFKAKQEEGVYLSDVDIMSLSDRERQKLVLKAFDVKAPRRWKYRTSPVRRNDGGENSKKAAPNSV